MTSSKIMDTSEFLKIMADNASDFADFEALSDEKKEQIANANIVTGCAEAFYWPDGTLVGVGGIRYKGVGEAWMITPRHIQSHSDPTQRQAQFLDLFTTTKESMDRMIDENNLWRVFATGTLSTSFLEKIGYKRNDKIMVLDVNRRPNGHER